MYRTTYELSCEEFEELRERFYYEVDDEGEFDYIADIPDKVIHNYYNSVVFVEEDFWCNV